jgi:hypothetical protein
MIAENIFIVFFIGFDFALRMDFHNKVKMSAFIAAGVTQLHLRVI